MNFKGKIIVIKVKKLPANLFELDEKKIAYAYNKAITMLTDVPKTVDAWRLFFKDKDSIGCKLNCLAGINMSTLPPLVKALQIALTNSGIKFRNFFGFERSRRELKRAGYSYKSPVLTFATDEFGYSRELYSYKEVYSLLSNVLLRKTTALVYFGKLKDHNLAGITGVLKNNYGLIHNPNKYHMNNCDPYVAYVNCIPEIKNIYRLSILDAINVQYHGGPSYKPQWEAKLGYIIIGRDPVAVDSYSTTLINKLRNKKGLPSLKEEKRPVKYLSTAQKEGLGISEPDKITVKFLEV